MQKEATAPSRLSLGQYLASLRLAKRFSLRAVEEASAKSVSNAYLSQLEHGRITQPSPNILHSLAGIYGVSYEGLMEKAGYIVASDARPNDRHHGRVPTLAGEPLSKEEEEELLKYLGYLRSHLKKNAPR